jgi:hypothetical protein
MAYREMNDTTITGLSGAILALVTYLDRLTDQTRSTDESLSVIEKAVDNLPA